MSVRIESDAGGGLNRIAVWDLRNEFFLPLREQHFYQSHIEQASSDHNRHVFEPRIAQRIPGTLLLLSFQLLCNVRESHELFTAYLDLCGSAIVAVISSLWTFNFVGAQLFHALFSNCSERSISGIPEFRSAEIICTSWTLRVGEFRHGVMRRSLSFSGKGRRSLQKPQHPGNIMCAVVAIGDTEASRWT